MLSTKLILNLFVEGTISLRTAYYGGKMDELIKKALEELIEIKDIGSTIAQSIIKYFKNETGRKL